jgi:hypothetical protein
MDNLTGAEWIIAVLSPGSLAPHPNWPLPRVTPAQLVALFLEGRFAEYERHFRLLQQEPTDLTRLVDAIQSSQQRETQAAGISRLQNLLDETRATLPMGAYAVGTLFTSLGLAELSRPNRAATLLRAVTRQMQERPSEHEGSFGLILGTLRQQEVMRLLEASQFSLATEAASILAYQLPKSTDAFENFVLPPPMRKSATSVQKEALAGLRRRARVMEETLGIKDWVPGRLWRPSWDDSHSTVKVSTALAELTSQQYRSTMGSTRTVLFASGDPVDGGLWSSLMQAELAGDDGEARSRRQLLGEVRAMSGARSSNGETMLDAAKLLRRARDSRSLSDLLRWIRSEGPVETLARLAVDLLIEVMPASAASEFDVSILSAAADVLPEGALRDSIEWIRSYRTAPEWPGQLTAAWARQDAILRATTNLAPGSGEDRSIAADVLDILISRPQEVEPLLRSIESVVRAIDWTVLPESSRASWITWARRQKGPTAGLALTVLDHCLGVARHNNYLKRPIGIDLGVRLLWENAHGVEAVEAEVREAVKSCTASLHSTQEGARIGRYGLGGYSPAEIAALLAVRLGRLELWDPLIEFLLDPNVSHEDKSRAFEQLADLKPELPIPAWQSLREAGWTRLSSGSSFFDGDSGVPFSTSSLRCAVALNLLDDRTVRELFAQLSGTGTIESKVETARCIGATGRGRHSEWAEMLLIQLSHDNAAVVRGQAGLWLGGAYNSHAATGAIIADRLQQLMRSEGILVPLLSVRGLSAMVEPPSGILTALREIAETHRSRSVRRAAVDVSASI